MEYECLKLSLWQLQPREELQYGQVSTAELVQAVDEMLSAAGISMGLEKKNLLQKTITLQEQLESSQAALLIEQVYYLLSQNYLCDIVQSFIEAYNYCAPDYFSMR